MNEQDPTAQPFPSGDVSQLNVPRVLVITAVIAWVFSLMLPGFWLHGRESPVSGFEILFLGTLFGWLGGPAAYANIVFFYVVRKAYSGKSAPYAVVIMLGLMATVAAFNGMPQNEGGGNAPLQSWGWGAIIWASSLIVAVAASVAAAVSSSGSTLGRVLVVVLVGSIPIAVTIVAGIRSSQWEIANEQDRAVFLPPLSAFTVAELCRAPFVDVPSPIIPQGELIAIHIDQALKSREGAPYFPELPNLGGVVTEGELTYVVYDKVPGWAGAVVRAQVSAKPARYLLRAENVEGGAMMRILNTETREVLYEQPLALRREGDRHGGLMAYCPDFYVSPSSGAIGVRQVLEKLVTPSAPVPAPAVIVIPETSNLQCDTSSPRWGAHGRNWVEWDGRMIDLNTSAYLDRPGFCSSNYAALVQVRLADIAGAARVFHGEVLLFDRASLRPIGLLETDPLDKTRLGKLARSDNSRWSEYIAPPGFVTGFTVTDADSATLHTSSGDVQVRSKAGWAAERN